MREQRDRHRLLIGAGVAGAALLALIVGAATIGRDAGKPGAGARPGSGQAPAIEIPRLDAAGTVSLAAFRGRPVVVNFFASWCGPCRRELPGFQSVSERMGSKVAFLGIDHQDNRDGALAMLAEAGVRFPSGYDPGGTVARSFGLFGMPTTVFVGADGSLLETHTGELSEQKLEESISRLFGV